MMLVVIVMIVTVTMIVTIERVNRHLFLVSSAGHCSSVVET